MKGGDGGQMTEGVVIPATAKREAGGLFRIFLFEEGLQDFRGGDGVETLFFLSPGKVGSGQFPLGAESAQSLILEVDGDVETLF